MPLGGSSEKIPLAESKVTHVGKGDPSDIVAVSWKPSVCVACSNVSSGNCTWDVCAAGRFKVGNSRTAMKPWLESAVVTPVIAPPAAAPLFVRPVAPTVFAGPVVPPLLVSPVALPLPCRTPPVFPLEPAVSPAAGMAFSTPVPSSVYVTTPPGAAAPEPPFALDGPAVHPPGADGIAPLLVALDALDGAVFDPLPATVTMPPVPEE